MTHGVLEPNTTGIPSGDEDVRQYLQEIRQYPRLTVQEERELAQRCAAGDDEAIRKMVNCNLRLVVSVAREYAGRGLPLLDMIQEGSIGLIAAAKRFDHTLEYRFSTYATKWIRQGILRSLNDHAGLIRVPAHTARRIRRLLLTQAAFQQEFGRTPTRQELAQRLSISAQKVAQLQSLIPETCSLDAPVGEDGDLSGLIPMDEASQPQAELIRQELKALLDALMKELSPRQAQILRLHFGMADGECHSLEDIGKLLGISKERARQVERQAMERLQTLGATFGLEDFLNE